MASLGEFGRAVAEFEGEADDFTFHGEPFTIPAAFSDLPVLKFANASVASQRASEAAEARAKTAQSVIDDPRADEARKAVATADLTAAQYEAQVASAEFASAAYDFIRDAVGHTQWPRFEAIAVQYGSRQDELIELASLIYSAVSGRPTRRPSISTGGPSSTGDGSTDGSGSPGETPGPRPPSTDSATGATLLSELPRRRDFDVPMATVDDIAAGRVPIPSGG
jgi:hypothetical protein